MWLVKVVFLKQEVINKKPSRLTGFFYFLYFSMLSLIAAGENPKSTNTRTTTKTTIKIEAIKAIGIQRGEVTHHQDQSMFPVSLRTKNITNNNPDNPIPEEELFDSIIYYIPNLSNKLFLF
jgi:hypothetical protein